MRTRGRGRGATAGGGGYALFLGWAAAGLALMVWWAFSWSDPDRLRDLELGLERWYGLRPGQPRWLLAADGHFHLVTAFASALWLGVGCRLFAPSRTVWLPLVAVAAISLIDEGLQLLSPLRHADLLDQVWAGAGLIAAVPLLIKLRAAGRRNQKATAQ